MKQISRLLAVLLVNTVFSLSLFVFVLGQIVCFDARLSCVETTISVDATGVSLTECGPTSSPLEVVFPKGKSANRWRDLFPLISNHSWENIACAFDDGFVMSPLRAKGDIYVEGTTVIELRPSRFGVRHWLLIVTTSGLFLFTHLQRLWVVLWRRGESAEDNSTVAA